MQTCRCSVGCIEECGRWLPRVRAGQLPLPFLRWSQTFGSGAFVLSVPVVVVSLSAAFRYPTCGKLTPAVTIAMLFIIKRVVLYNQPGRGCAGQCGTGLGARLFVVTDFLCLLHRRGPQDANNEPSHHRGFCTVLRRSTNKPDGGSQDNVTVVIAVIVGRFIFPLATKGEYFFFYYPTIPNNQILQLCSSLRYSFIIMMDS